MMPVPLALGPDLVVALHAREDQWGVTPQQHDGKSSPPGSGASEALVALLASGADLPADWQVLRLATVPEVSGERPIDVDQTNTSVVVGERLVVKWLRSVADRPHPGLAALAQLDAVGFEQTPTAYAVVTWTSPHGHTLPIAYVTDYLEAARDGWSWCVDLVRSLGQPGRRDLGTDPWALDLPARLGELAASLHLALATSNHVFPRPVQPAGAIRAQRWHDDAFAMLDAAAHVADPHSSAAVVARAEAIAECFDDVLGDDRALAHSPVQHIHGDLHVGQILRWAGGLSIVDFDGNPVAPTEGGMLQPAARDVAQLVRSLDHVGQIVLHRSPEVDPIPIREWMGRCRHEFLDSYRHRLGASGMGTLLDERLLPAFELEQELRELVYAARHLHRWSYAPLASLADLLPLPSR